MNNKKISLALPLLLAIMLVIGIFAGMKLKNTQNQNTANKTVDNKIISVLNYIDQWYVESVSKSRLIEIAIPAMLESLDPHSTYIRAEDLVTANESLEGNFSGIGIQFNMQNDTVAIIQTIPNGPSEKLGILAGDRIIRVNDSLIAGVNMSSDKIVGMLKGKKGTTVKVSILRKGVPELINFEIIRDRIPLYSIDVAYMVTDEIGYIKISQFSKTTHREFIDAIEELKSLGMLKIIIDVRNNGGGFMGAATKIANEFLEQGKLIVYTEGRANPRTNYYAESSGSCLNYEVVILIDEFSASASEILAGALQDNDRATIVGRRSFGKGLVQEQTIFSDGSAIRLTVARYYTPTGRCIQKPYKNGLLDYYNELNDRYINGEFESRDSITFPDSLKYITPEGKLLYGGGGIMPDVFVPIDTVGITPYYINVRNKGLLYRFAFQYADQNRETLSKLKDYKAFESYLRKVHILDTFLSFASQNGVKEIPYNNEQSLFLIETQLKAQIARNIIDNEGYYPIIEKVDYTLKKGIEILVGKI